MCLDCLVVGLQDGQAQGGHPLHGLVADTRDQVSTDSEPILQ